ncbi:hypothetical protein [Bradyrhizobium sp. STM 3566]|uniref:hypothetical protein n=1 Tax=Bradyrhizobium sp. STM 3566 TaxID=578928 RepID=UPI0038909EC2
MIHRLKALPRGVPETRDLDGGRLAGASIAKAMTASACFFSFFSHRAFWYARAPALLCKVSLRRMVRKETS